MASANGNLRDVDTALTRSIVENSIICFWISDMSGLLEHKQRQCGTRVKRILSGQFPSKLHSSQDFSELVVPALKHLEEKSQPVIGNRPYDPPISPVPVVIRCRHARIPVGKYELCPCSIARLRKPLERQLSHFLLINLEHKNKRLAATLPHGTKRGTASGGCRNTRRAGSSPCRRNTDRRRW